MATTYPSFWFVVKQANLTKIWLMKIPKSPALANRAGFPEHSKYIEKVMEYSASALTGWLLHRSSIYSASY